MFVLLRCAIRNERHKHLLLRWEADTNLVLPMTNLLRLLSRHCVWSRTVFHLAETRHLVCPLNHHIHLRVGCQKSIRIRGGSRDTETFQYGVDMGETEPLETQPQPSIVARSSLQMEPGVAVVTSFPVKKQESPPPKKTSPTSTH